MDVLHHLQEILKSEKSIGIIGLGTFYKKKNPGRYDSKMQSFLPPNYTLNFKTSVDEKEVFAILIAQTENINLDASKEKIKEFVDFTHHQLANQLQIQLEGIGKIILINKELNFVADPDNIYEQEFFGFPEINEIPINQQVSVDDKINGSAEAKSTFVTPSSETLLPKTEKVVSKPIVIPTTIEENTNEQELASNDSFEENDDNLSGMNKTLKIFIFLIVILGLLGLAYLYKPSIFEKILTINNPIEEKTESALPISPNNKEIIKKDNDTTKTLNNDSNIVAENLPDILNTNITTYEVIGSAERSQKRIDFVINTMKKKGIEAKALENLPGKLVKISLGSFTDFNLAKKYKDSLRKKLNNPEIYIQTIKPKK